MRLNLTQDDKGVIILCALLFVLFAAVLNWWVLTPLVVFNLICFAVYASACNNHWDRDYE